MSFPTGREGFEALLGGQVDITFMAEFPAATGALRDQEFGLIADLARYTGSRIIGSRIIGSAEAGDLETPADLAGRRIGTTLGTNVNFFLSGVLEEAGVEAELVNASPVDLVSAVARGDVDAIVPFPTFYSAARDALGEDYRELRVDSYQVHYVLAASPAMLARETALEAFLGALVKADEQVAEAPGAAMEAVAASMQGAMPVAAIETMWSDVDLGLRLGADLLDLLVAEAAWIVEQGVVNADPLSREEMASFFAGGPLAAVDASRVQLD